MAQAEHRTVLLVEDEWLIAAVTAGILEDEGYRVIGPAASVAQGMALIEAETIDAALLDVNLSTEPSYALADALIERGTPVMLLTGYKRADLPDRFLAVPMLCKPVEQGALLRAVEGLITKSPSST